MAERRILFVCLGNICRSPLAEGILRHQAREAGLLERLEIDSAGTCAHHVGEPPDERSAAVARRCGVSLDGQRGRQVHADDFERFDLLLAMDAQNERDLLQRCPPAHRGKVRRIGTYDPGGDADVPDPYYGGPSGFDDVFSMLERSCRRLLEEVRQELDG